jgi:hypothetical protein
MATNVSPSSALTIPIAVNISLLRSSHLSNASCSIFLAVSLENTSSQPLYFLRWSSPLDSRSSALGVFKFTSESTGEQAPGLNLKISRKLPHPAVFAVDDENMITIGAGQTIEDTVEVAERDVQLKGGDVYLVKAVGRWVGAWLGERTELAMNNESGFMIGEYESNEIRITAPV